ncbi:MAG: helix-turn-helix transcriptional regulator [Chloroflexi bacterium]|nr:helix-turn-helix transcriptional regulator [Chloroflexota bacterium]
MVDAASFASTLRTLRRKHGYTQNELAERAGLSVRTISDLERGDQDEPEARHRASARRCARGWCRRVVGVAGRGDSTAHERPRGRPTAQRRASGCGLHNSPGHQICETQRRSTHRLMA